MTASTPKGQTYIVELWEDMPVEAYIWLRNNKIAYEESYGFRYSDEQVVGMTTVLEFENIEDATWFKLKWG